MTRGLGGFRVSAINEAFREDSQYGDWTNIAGPQELADGLAAFGSSGIGEALGQEKGCLIRRLAVDANESW